MHNYIDLAALGKVLLASLLAGVGLVAIFGVGLVGLSRHERAMAQGTYSARRGVAVRPGSAWPSPAT